MAQTAKMGGQTALLWYCIRQHYLCFCDGFDTAKNGGATSVTVINLGLHVACPIMTLILFFYVENTN